MTIEIKRLYEYSKEYSKAARPAGAYVVLLDRVWPRGIRKEELALDEWPRHLAPSHELRKWFGHQVERWPEFQRRYRQELKPLGEELERLRHLAKSRHLILLYGARDTEHNQAVVLRELLQQGRQHPEADT